MPQTNVPSPAATPVPRKIQPIGVSGRRTAISAPAPAKPKAIAPTKTPTAESSEPDTRAITTLAPTSPIVAATSAATTSTDVRRARIDSSSTGHPPRATLLARAREQVLPRARSSARLDVRAAGGP